MGSFHPVSSSKAQHELIVPGVLRQSSSVAQLCVWFCSALGKPSQALVGVCVCSLWGWGLLRRRGRAAEESRNAETIQKS